MLGLEPPVLVLVLVLALAIGKTGSQFIREGESNADREREIHGLYCGVLGCWAIWWGMSREGASSNVLGLNSSQIIYFLSFFQYIYIYTLYV